MDTDIFTASIERICHLSLSTKDPSPSPSFARISKLLNPLPTRPSSLQQKLIKGLSLHRPKHAAQVDEIERILLCLPSIDIKDKEQIAKDFTISLLLLKKGKKGTSTNDKDNIHSFIISILSSNDADCKNGLIRGLIDQAALYNIQSLNDLFPLLHKNVSLSHPKASILPLKFITKVLEKSSHETIISTTSNPSSPMSSPHLEPRAYLRPILQQRPSSNLTEQEDTSLSNIYDTISSTLLDTNRKLAAPSLNGEPQELLAMKAYHLRILTAISLLRMRLSTPLRKDLLETLPHCATSKALAKAVMSSISSFANLSNEMKSLAAKELRHFITSHVHTPATASSTRKIWNTREEIILLASKNLANILKLSSQDVIVTTIYTLANFLAPESVLTFSTDETTKTLASFVPPTFKSEDEKTIRLNNVVQAIAEISNVINDEAMTILCVSLLSQKLGSVNEIVGRRIVWTLGEISIQSTPKVFKKTGRIYAKLADEQSHLPSHFLYDAVMKTRVHMSQNLGEDNVKTRLFLLDLLNAIVAKPHKTQEDKGQLSTILLCIESLLRDKPTHILSHDAETISAFRNTWLTLVLNSFTYQSELAETHAKALSVLAMFTPLMVSKDTDNDISFDLEQSTVLRSVAGKPGQSDLRKKLIKIFRKKSEVEDLSYSKLVFINALILVQHLRARQGICSQSMLYLHDPVLLPQDLTICVQEICNYILTQSFLQEFQRVSTLTAMRADFSNLMVSCCSNIKRERNVSVNCVDALVARLPTLICSRDVLFNGLDLLNLLWNGCVEEEITKYMPTYGIQSRHSDLTIELSDSYEYRQETFDQFYRYFRSWLLTSHNESPSEIQGLLLTYLYEFDDANIETRTSPGRSLALEVGQTIPIKDTLRTVAVKSKVWRINHSSDFLAQFSTRQLYRNVDTFTTNEKYWSEFLAKYNVPNLANDRTGANAITLALEQLELRIRSKKYVEIQEIREVLRRATANLFKSDEGEHQTVRRIVYIPYAIFSQHSMSLGISLWNWIMSEKGELKAKVIMEICRNWLKTIHNQKGLFSDKLNLQNPFVLPMEFAPSDNSAHVKSTNALKTLLSPHLEVLHLLMDHYSTVKFESRQVVYMLVRLLQETFENSKKFAHHPLTRYIRLLLVNFGFKILHTPTIGKYTKAKLRCLIYKSLLDWYCLEPAFQFGGDVLQLHTEMDLMEQVLGQISHDFEVSGRIPVLKTSTTRNWWNENTISSTGKLVKVFMHLEYNRLIAWDDPMNDVKKSTKFSRWGREELLDLLTLAMKYDVLLALNLSNCVGEKYLVAEMKSLISKHSSNCLHSSEAAKCMLGNSLSSVSSGNEYSHLLLWDPVSPITAVNYFLPGYANNAFVLQYAVRSLETHPVEVTFFYVPQIVQALRYDVLGYVEKFILQTAKVSQLFAHQIIWNMKANMFKDDDSSIPDPLKPTLDDMIEKIVRSLSGEDKNFYEREFTFFDEVTSISGKLKPYIKKSKQEKKVKIDEEMSLIKLDKGVYLPSNPDGVVIGIDRKSGRPLQSHAKAPFMATFLIQRSKAGLDTEERLIKDEEHQTKREPILYEKWQSAIFKVGDDCRQDVLALQLISMFRNIYNSVGLSAYVFPYKVTATAPGCGVIDVLPNSISRDMLGRETVNALYDYFINKYGPEDSVEFQKARNAFVQSMAGYSVICYMLQFKDRHNGNIMIDGEGHILHIDFGFCFDIAPGGITFENAPFKLTREMIRVMGDKGSESYRHFEELCVKAYLACRKYSSELLATVQIMIDSGLPCFKGDLTIRRLRGRFMLDVGDREAADHMKECLKTSADNFRTGMYDGFQKLTNGIPY